MPNAIIKFNKCNICENNKLDYLFNLGKHFPADTFLKKSQKKLIIPEVSLECLFCSACLNIQLKKTLDQNLKYNLIDYSYTSSNSKKSKKYWDEYFKYLNKNFFNKISNILEIGANDGYLLEKFNKKKYNLFAYEISKKMSTLLMKKKIRSYNLSFEKISNKDLDAMKSKYDLIIANNVLNHSHNVKKFFFNISTLLSKTGKFFLEVPYAPWMIKNKKFELIYLEHINYFSLHSLTKLCLQNKLKIENVNFFNYHGKMIRLIISKNNAKSYFNILKNEKKFLNKKSLNFFYDSIKKKKEKFLKKIFFLLNSNKNLKLVAIGASAKTNTVLNFFNLTKNQVSFVTDNSNQKVGKYIPNKKIPICTDEDLKKLKDIIVFFSTWNIADFVKKKLHKINKNIKILQY